MGTFPYEACKILFNQISFAGKYFLQIIFYHILTSKLGITIISDKFTWQIMNTFRIHGMGAMREGDYEPGRFFEE